MARYDLYRSRDGNYLLEVQSDLLDEFETTVVVPVRRPEDAPAPGRRLNPAFMVDGETHYMVTQYISAVPRVTLGQNVDNLDRHHDEILAALDMLSLGY